MENKLKKKLKAIQVDYWKHPEHSTRVLKIISNNGDASKEVAETYSFSSIPKMKRPKFWQFKKKRQYKEECDKILEELKVFIINE
jgi:hypothetical protein